MDSNLDIMRDEWIDNNLSTLHAAGVSSEDVKKYMAIERVMAELRKGIDEQMLIDSMPVWYRAYEMAKIKPGTKAGKLNNHKNK